MPHVFRTIPRFSLLLVFLIGLALLLSSNSASAAWKVPLDGGCTTHRHSRIVVSGKVVYASSADGAVYAFDLSDGKQIWSFQTGEGLTSGPEIVTVPDDSLESMVEAVTRPTARKGTRGIFATPILKNGTIYVGSGDMHFYALNASTGSLKWSFDAGKNIRTDAIVSDRFVYFKAGDIRRDAPDTIHALNATDGSEAWAFEGKNEIGGPVLADGTIYLVEASQHRFKPEESAIRALDAESGKERWAFALPPYESHEPTVSGNLLFYLDGETLHALDLSSGAPVWQFAVGVAGIKNRVLATQEHVFLGVGFFEGDLFGLNKKTGELLWALALPGDFDVVDFHLDERLYVVHKSRLLAVNADSGEVMWKTRLGFDALIESVVDGVVYASNRQTLIAIDSVTGKKLWKFKTPFRALGLAGILGAGDYADYCSPPTKAGELLLFSTSTKEFWGVEKTMPGYLYAIESKTGKIGTK